MERELILTVKKDKYDDVTINKEIECIKNLFPYLESFDTFARSNQVFDLEKHNIVKKANRLRFIFDKGAQTNNSFIVSLN